MDPVASHSLKKKKQESLTKLGIYAKEVDRGTLGTHSHYSTRFSFMNLGRHFFKQIVLQLLSVSIVICLTLCVKSLMCQCSSCEVHSFCPCLLQLFFLFFEDSNNKLPSSQPSKINFFLKLIKKKNLNMPCVSTNVAVAKAI